jgi:cyclic pyranopterin phosphate synthase
MEAAAMKPVPLRIARVQPAPDGGARRPVLPLRDSFERACHYLRLSVTDVCNFQCAYCLPDGYRRPVGAEPPLTVEEIRNLVSGFASMGLWKVRLTGGEPTVRRDIVDIVRAVASVGGIRKVALTTNACRLTKLAAPLREAGLTSLNVSVDSLDRRRFHEITGQDRLDEVLAGIDAAFDAGFDWIKVNAVLLRDWNDVDLNAFLGWIRERSITVRFIELMRTGDNSTLFARHHVSAASIQARLVRDGWMARAREEGDGPAMELVHPEYRGRIGLIAPYSKDFCTTCNRLRVSSQGGLRLCLFGEADHSLRAHLQTPDQLEELRDEVQRLIGQKAVTHDLHRGNHGTTSHFAAIGG